MAETAYSRLPARSAMDRVTVLKKTNPLHNATPVMVMVQLKRQSAPTAVVWAKLTMKKKTNMKRKMMMKRTGTRRRTNARIPKTLTHSLTRRLGLNQGL
ncbi:hypothetical protein BB775_21050 [Enterobacter roggenkampii]|uniref:Uncharacterized protein n=1 Tax=Enterobacter roggenkampii TaxID=1812935 RepID=A0A837LFA0_9ENTR|nr:hypothetical protein ABF77_10705 [Enterobacter roggenkampii]KUT44893.1 hypothetical protein AWE96_22200 [Escherichia coli]OHY39691.1 hypothetical protein BBX43_25550 [Enterobacter roggenkampii]OHY58879.1 hypothetical protein BB775_21050 [Enterobacter roggenkampii]